MNKEIKDFFGGENTPEMREFFDILDKSDEEFESIAPVLEKIIEAAMLRPDAQDRIINIVSVTPFENNESSREMLNEIVEKINNDSTLSQKKKDLLIRIVKRSTDTAIEYSKNPREKIPVKVELLDDTAKIPTYAHNSDAGADIYSNNTVEIKPNETMFIPTGFKIAVPQGYAAYIYPRSGLSAKTKLRIANSVGVIDSDFRGEVKVIMNNIGNENITINKGDRIAQMIINKVPMIKFEIVEKLDQTERGTGGFGSTGTS